MVIAIIAILAAMLLPALSRAKLRAQQISCVNSLKQLTLANIMYVSDNKVWVGPLSTNIAFSQGDWMGAMLNYYANTTNILFCPVAPDKGAVGGGNTFGTADKAWDLVSGTNYSSSYGYNDWLAGNGLRSPNPYPNGGFKNDSSLQNSVLTPMFLDATWLNFDPIESDAPARDLYNGGGGGGPSGMARITIARHGGRSASAAPKSVPAGTAMIGTIDIGFADGHVEQVKLENLWTLYWHRDWKTPTPRPF